MYNGKNESMTSYRNTLEPHTDHSTSSILHMAAALNDTMDLLHDHGYHHHILSLPPDNITLARVFHPTVSNKTVPMLHTFGMIGEYWQNH